MRKSLTILLLLLCVKSSFSIVKIYTTYEDYKASTASSTYDTLLAYDFGTGKGYALHVMKGSEKSYVLCKAIWGYTIGKTLYRCVESHRNFPAKVIWSTNFYFYETVQVIHGAYKTTDAAGNKVYTGAQNMEGMDVAFSEKIDSEIFEIPDPWLYKMKHRKTIAKLKDLYPKFDVVFDCIKDKDYRFGYYLKDFIKCFESYKKY